MKKLLLLLIVAFGAVTAFAQSVTPRHQVFNAPGKTLPSVTDFSSSLFTKDAVPIATVDFSAFNMGYTTGVITAGPEAHSQNFDFAVWHRWPNLDESTLSYASSVYPYLVSTLFGSQNEFESFFRSYLDTSFCSADNGFMMVSSYDQRTPHSGNFNSYIQIDSIDATEADIVDVSFFQIYRKYYDHCYLDYSIDGGVSWTEMEINVDGLDVSSSNPYCWGMYRYTLPTSAAGHVLSIRIRYKSLDSDRLSYGYFWCLDDVKVYAGTGSRFNTYQQEFVEGNYGMVPQGMTINPAWYSTVLNTGIYNQTNVQTNLYHLDANRHSTLFASYNNGTLPIDTRLDVMVDCGGWLNSDLIDFRGWYGIIDHTPHGVGTSLPTTTAGDNYMFVQLTTDSGFANYDTMYYQVTTANANNEYRWAHDNGVLTYSPNNYFLFGYSSSNGHWYYSDDINDVQFSMPGYTVTSRYTTDSIVPDDWVIHGVELVASPIVQDITTGATISATLLRDEYEGESVNFLPVVTGANRRELTNEDLNRIDDGLRSNGYLTQGQYNTIYIPFPEQPTLTPNTSFRVGYKIEEPSYFMLAQEAQGSYLKAHPTREGYDTILYFANSDSTSKWAHHFTSNLYQTLVIDQNHGESIGDYIFPGADYNPMIRLIVGPRRPIIRQNVSVECENGEYGHVLYAEEEVCGTTITPAQGGSATVTFETRPGCGIAHVYVDSIDEQPWDHDTEEGNYNYQLSFDRETNVWTGHYTFENIQSDHSIKVAFAAHASLDPIAAHIGLTLHPNPATSQVNLNIEGVEGVVNCMLIDMSGRVVYNQNMNAAKVQTINVSNLAKGAYFIRITNEEFSKVEKLIVR